MVYGSTESDIEGAGATPYSSASSVVHGTFQDCDAELGHEAVRRAAQGGRKRTSQWVRMGTTAVGAMAVVMAIGALSSNHSTTRSAASLASSADWGFSDPKGASTGDPILGDGSGLGNTYGTDEVMGDGDTSAVEGVPGSGVDSGVADTDGWSTDDRTPVGTTTHHDHTESCGKGCTETVEDDDTIYDGASIDGEDGPRNADGILVPPTKPKTQGSTGTTASDSGISGSGAGTEPGQLAPDGSVVGNAGQQSTGAKSQAPPSSSSTTAGSGMGDGHAKNTVTDDEVSWHSLGGDGQGTEPGQLAPDGSVVGSITGSTTTVSTTDTTVTAGSGNGDGHAKNTVTDDEVSWHSLGGDGQGTEPGQVAPDGSVVGTTTVPTADTTTTASLGNGDGHAKNTVSDDELSWHSLGGDGHGTEPGQVAPDGSVVSPALTNSDSSPPSVEEQGAMDGSGAGSEPGSVAPDGSIVGSTSQVVSGAKSQAPPSTSTSSDVTFIDEPSAETPGGVEGSHPTKYTDDDGIPDPSKGSHGATKAHAEAYDEVGDYSNSERYFDDENDPDGQMFLYLARKDREPLGVCLDGSQPGFYHRPGFGSGENRWLIHLKGGGWCHSPEDCATWVSTGYQAGSDNLPYNFTGKGIMSVNPIKNPNYFNWNIVYVDYCDGGSYVGYKGEPSTWKDKYGEKQTVYTRGSLVFKSVIKTLKFEHNMGSAEDILLVGTSAGALGVMHQCENLKYDSGANVGCIMDAGFFYDSQNFAGETGIQTEFWKGVSKTHFAEGFMDSSCEKHEDDPNSCFIAGHALKYISSPIFLVQSSTDYWQLLKNYFFNVTDGIECLKDPIRGCTPETFEGIQSYHYQTLQALTKTAGANEYVSWFVDSCFAHSQLDTDKLFDFTKINGTGISETLYRWFNASAATGTEDAITGTRVIDAHEWPHAGQECAWGPEWNAYVTNHSESLEFGDNHIKTGDADDDAYLTKAQYGSAADASGKEDTLHDEGQEAVASDDESSTEGENVKAHKANKGKKASGKGTDKSETESSVAKSKSSKDTKTTKTTKATKTTSNADGAAVAAPESSPAASSTSSSALQTPTHEAMPSMPGLEEAYEMIEALRVFDEL